METQAARGCRIRESPSRVGPLRIEGASLPCGHRPLPDHRGLRWPELLRRLGLGLVLGYLGLGVAQAQTYTGSPLNLWLPAEDSFDWKSAWDFNFGVLNSSFSALSTVNLDALSASTASLATSVAALSASTVSIESSKLALAGGTVTGPVTHTGAFSHSGASVTIAHGLSAATMTATAFSSAPLVNVSSISSPGDFKLYTNGGYNLLYAGTSGVDGLQVNKGAWTGTPLYNLEVWATSSPDLAFRLNNTSVVSGDNVGTIFWNERDSSTGGRTDKMRLRGQAAEGWGSGDSMEMRLYLAFARQGGTLYDGIVFTSTGVSIGSAGTATNTPPSCGTCTFQVISPSGSGSSFAGKVQVDGFFQPKMVTASELATLTPDTSGQIVVNISNASLCISSGSTIGAWILPRSTSTTANIVPCY